MELDKKIAELLGWEWEGPERRGSDTGYYDPKGHLKWTTRTLLPKWSTQVELAIELLKGLEWGLTHDIDYILEGHPEYACWIRRGSTFHGQKFGATPAEAICNAWIRYKEERA